MDSWVRAILRIYEFSAILTITILPTLATVYAIIVSFLGRLVRHADEEFRRLKKENEERIAARRKELSKRDKSRKTTKEALAEVKGWEEELRGLIEREENWKKQVEGWSFTAIFVKPAGWILGGLLGILVAYGTLNVLPSSLYCWRILLSLIPFFGGLAFVAVGLCNHIIPCLMEIDESARKPEETPVEAVQRILREQTEQSSKEQRETFERLIAKMDEVVRALLPKEPEFDVYFVKEGKKVKEISITQGEETPIDIVVTNKSPFPAKGIRVELVLTPDFTLRKSIDDTPFFRHEHVSIYPGGADLLIELPIMEVFIVVIRRFLIKGQKKGEIEMPIWIHSETHERYKSKINVRVK